MYCTKCGNLLEDTDQNCRKCGEPTGFKTPDESDETIRKTEDVSSNPLNTDIDNKGFITDVDEASDKEIKDTRKQRERKEDKYIEKQESNSEKTNPPKDDEGEFVWDVHDFTEHKKTEGADIEFNWRLEDYSEADNKKNKEPILEETLFQEIKDESNKSNKSKIDRFYTFNKKNEEFQKLLDKEYERLKGKQPGEALDNTPQDNLRIPEMLFDDIELTSDHDKAAKSFAPLTDQSDTADITGQNTEKVEQPEIKSEESSLNANTGTENFDELSVAGTMYFANNQIDGNEIEQTQIPDSDAKEQAQIPGSGTKEQEEIFDKDAIEQAQLNDSDSKGQNQIITDADNEITAKDSSEAKAAVATPINHKEDGVEEKKGKRNRLGRAILIIIAIILAIEIAILGIRYFAPNSAMAKTINNAQTQIISTVAGWINGDDDVDPTSGGAPEAIDDENGDENKDPKEVISEPDPKPMSDKAALISSQMDNNKNIIKVKNNDKLEYQAGRDYGLSDINNSKPIENNIWKTSEGEEPVFYDQSIVGTIISFDSQWIDYVNEGDKSVLNLLKEDSRAYRNAVNFSKLGKVKETFQLLEIGDIRQGSDGFYVWTYEEMQITENGKTNDLKYSWIYHLEPVNGEIKIVNYIKY